MSRIEDVEKRVAALEVKNVDLPAGDPLDVDATIKLGAEVLKRAGWGNATPRVVKPTREEVGKCVRYVAGVGIRSHDVTVDNIMTLLDETEAKAVEMALPSMDKILNIVKQYATKIHAEILRQVPDVPLPERLKTALEEEFYDAMMEFFALLKQRGWKDPVELVLPSGPELDECRGYYNQAKEIIHWTVTKTNILSLLRTKCQPRPESIPAVKELSHFIRCLVDANPDWTCDELAHNICGKLESKGWQPRPEATVEEVSEFMNSVFDNYTPNNLGYCVALLSHFHITKREDTK